MKLILHFLLLLCLAATANAQPSNNTLRGKILYQSSGNKPAVGVRIAEPDATAVFSVDNGEYLLKFQNKRNGASLDLEVGKDDGKGQKLELVNEKEVKAAKLPADAENILEIIVCPAGQRDIAAQRYYRILRTTADHELEKVKKEFEILLVQKDKDYKKITDLSELITNMQAALDSSKIHKQAFNIASINLDRASQLVKDAVKKIDEANDVEGALRILNAEALDTAYEHASALKKQAEVAIRQVIEGYEFKISLLEPQFKYREVAECYEKIAGIYEKEDYNKEKLVQYFDYVAENLRRNGEYKKALAFGIKALAIREKSLPSDYPHLAPSYTHMALIYRNLGEYQKQLEYNLKALAIWEKILPADHTELAKSYTNLASTYFYLSEYQKALEFNMKALSIQEKVLPADHIDLTLSYNSLSLVYNNLGEYQKALEFNLKELTIREKIQPASHPDLASAYNNRALIYEHLGEYQKVLELHVKSLTIFEKVLSANHPDLAISYNNLATTYYYLSNYQKQLEFNLKALTIREKVLSTNHPDLAQSYNNLALTYENLGDYQKALEYNQKALAIQEKSLPTDHLDLARSNNNLAFNYHHLGEYEKALESSLKALAIREKVLPVDHPDLAVSYSNIGRAYRDVDDYEKGIEYAQKAIRIGESSRPKHSGLNRFYANLGITYVKARQYPEAKTALEKSEALKTEERVYRGWAMYYALKRQKKQAVESLQKALPLGFKDLKWLESEPDLKNIRKEKGYKEIVEQLKKGK